MVKCVHMYTHVRSNICCFPQIVANASLFARVAKLDDVSCEEKLLDLIVITERQAFHLPAASQKIHYFPL